MWIWYERHIWMRQPKCKWWQKQTNNIQLLNNSAAVTGIKQQRAKHDYTTSFLFYRECNCMGYWMFCCHRELLCNWTYVHCLCCNDVVIIVVVVIVGLYLYAHNAIYVWICLIWLGRFAVWLASDMLIFFFPSPRRLFFFLFIIFLLR